MNAERERVAARRVRIGDEASIHGYRCRVVDVESWMDRATPRVRLTGIDVATKRMHAATFNATTQTTRWSS